MKKMVRQKRDVFPALPERWYLDTHHIEPVVQVATEPPLFHHGHDVSVGRSNNAYVNPTRTIFSQSPNLPLLQDTQQPCLKGE